MARTQVPKSIGIALAVVGIPLIIWDAARANGELDALKASSNSQDTRVERCVAKTEKMLPDQTIRRHVCGCVVEKAAARGAFKDYGAYDEALLEPIIGECFRGDRD